MFNKASYQRWRDQLPWTDEAFASALDDSATEIEQGTGPDGGRMYQANRYRNGAAYLRETGRLASWMVRLALPRLITQCGLCEKPALYRYGHLGRCADHRSDVPQFIRDSRQRYERRQGTIGAQLSAKDAFLRYRENRDRQHRQSLGFK